MWHVQAFPRISAVLISQTESSFPVATLLPQCTAVRLRTSEPRLCFCALEHVWAPNLTLEDCPALRRSRAPPSGSITSGLAGSRAEGGPHRGGLAWHSGIPRAEAEAKACSGTLVPFSAERSKIKGSICGKVGRMLPESLNIEYVGIVELVQGV